MHVWPFTVVYVIEKALRMYDKGHVYGAATAFKKVTIEGNTLLVFIRGVDDDDCNCATSGLEPAEHTSLAPDCWHCLPCVLKMDVFT